MSKEKRKLDDEVEQHGKGKKTKTTTKTLASNEGDSNGDDAETDFSSYKCLKQSASGKEANYSIVSWNCGGIRAWVKKDGIKYVEREDADIVCLQEVKCGASKLPEEIKNKSIYKHQYWSEEGNGKKGYAGVGILSKHKAIKVTHGIGNKEYDAEGRVITLEFDDFYLVNAYVPNSGRGLVRLEYRMKWDKHFSKYLVDLDKEKPVILTGDLNVAHQEIDLANPKTNTKTAGFTKQERDNFTDFLSQGFVDTFRYLYPDLKGKYTFWSYFANARAKNVGWRLDYFVCSKRLLDKVCDNQIRSDVKGSDHCPLVLNIAF
jgi:AP endonuclease-1